MRHAAVANTVEVVSEPPVATGTGAIVPALSGVSATDLAAAYAQCREVTRTRARNFYYGLRITPEPRRSAIYSIYAWMRAADDAVDDEGDEEARRRRLAEFRTTTVEVLEGRRDPAPLGWLWVSLAATARSYPVEHTIFHDLLAGLEMDLDTSGFCTEEELSRYCYRVAGTAGLACLAIWGLRAGCDVAKARKLAVHRGEAFQRTNILRDFSQDFDEMPRRVYLAAESFAQSRVTPDEVRRWSTPQRCDDFVREQASRTRSHYYLSRELESMIDPACAPTLWAMTRIYSGLLERIETDSHRIVSSRIRLPSVQKASIAVSAAIKARMGRW